MSAEQVFIRPTLPNRFLWRWEGDEGYDGPFNSRDALFESNNALVFVGDGLPFRIGVVSQSGDRVQIQDGSRIRF